ncbi:MAG: trypsin-like peptidase domain-containing protein, partial [Candidatus Desantisbacteria bacterium]
MRKRGKTILQQKLSINLLCLILIVITPLLAEATHTTISLADMIEQLSPSVVIVKGETITQRFEPGKLIVTHNWQLGSGFIVESQGYILTCYHIINGIEDIKVILKDGTEYSAQIVKANKRADLCLLKIKANNLPSLKIGDPAIVRAGDFVITIGNPIPKQMNSAPKSLSNSVTTGIISSICRVNSDNLKLFQLNLPVNFGNSGGPLLNRQGQVIGVVNSKMLAFNGHSLEGIGFALSIKEAAAKKLSVSKEALVIPRRMISPMDGSPFFTRIRSFSSWKEKRLTSSPGKNLPSPPLSIRTLENIWRIITS